MEWRPGVRGIGTRVCLHVHAVILPLADVRKNPSDKLNSSVEIYEKIEQEQTEATEA